MFPAPLPVRIAHPPLPSTPAPELAVTHVGEADLKAFSACSRTSGQVAPGVAHETPERPPPYRKPPTGLGGLRGRPTLVVGAEDRVNMAAVGWVGNTSSGTGTLVGPRHVLMASHLLEWDEKGHPNKNIAFAPGYVNGVIPFGTFWFERVIALRLVVPDTNGELDEDDLAYDLAVGVVNGSPDDLGNKLGWFPTADWQPKWKTPRGLHHVGYPDGGSIPRVVAGGSVLGTVPRTTMDVPGRIICHDVDVTMGQSGGPLFVWGKLADPVESPDEPCLPLVVGVQSAEIPLLGFNTASGGPVLPQLVAYCVNTFP